MAGGDIERELELNLLAELAPPEATQPIAGPPEAALRGIAPPGLSLHDAPPPISYAGTPLGLLPPGIAAAPSMSTTQPGLLGSTPPPQLPAGLSASCLAAGGAPPHPPAASLLGGSSMSVPPPPPYGASADLAALLGVGGRAPAGITSKPAAGMFGTSPYETDASRPRLPPGLSAGVLTGLPPGLLPGLQPDAAAANAAFLGAAAGAAAAQRDAFAAAAASAAASGVLPQPRPLMPMAHTGLMPPPMLPHAGHLPPQAAAAAAAACAVQAAHTSQAAAVQAAAAAAAAGFVHPSMMTGNEAARMAAAAVAAGFMPPFHTGPEAAAAASAALLSAATRDANFPSSVPRLSPPGQAALPPPAVTAMQQATAPALAAAAAAAGLFPPFPFGGPAGDRALPQTGLPLPLLGRMGSGGLPPLPTAAAAGVKGPPKVLSVEEVEAEMHRAAAGGASSTRLVTEPPAAAPRVVYPTAAAAAAAAAAVAEARNAAASVTAAQRPESEEYERPKCKTIAPFTPAHRLLLQQEKINNGLQPFLRKPALLRGHPDLMSMVDKDNILRIQLTQMAALDNQSSAVRAQLAQRAKKAKEQHEAARQAEAEAIEGGNTPSSMLVSRLREAIGNLGGAAPPEEASDAAVATEPTEAPAAQGSTASETTKEGAEANEANAAAPEGGGSPADSLQSGLRSNVKFGTPLYASVHHPRRAITLPGAAEGDEEAPPEHKPPSESEEIQQEAEANSAEKVPSLATRWRVQVALERAFDWLLELELLTGRLLECHPADANQGERIRSERNGVIDRLTQLVLGEAPQQELSPEATDAANVEATTRLGALLERRKGRLLAARLLTCLLPAPGLADVGSPISLLWRLAPALLRCAPDMFGLSWSATRSPEDDTGSWLRLRLAFLTALEAACGPRASSSLAGEARCRSCAAALDALLGGKSDGDFVLDICGSRSGAALLRQLVEGCAGDRGACAADVEASLDAFIEGVCPALPKLYDAAVRGTRLPLPSAPLAPATERLGQDELWRLLVALAEQASHPQKRRIHTLIGGFVGTVAASPPPPPAR